MRARAAGIAVAAALVGWIAGALGAAPLVLPERYRPVATWDVAARGGEALVEPIGIAVGVDEIFVSDAGAHRIVVYGRDGARRRAFGREGDGPGELGRPMHLAWRDGRLYVAEYRNDRVQVFAPDGSSLAIVGGPDAGLFDAPAGVDVDAAGRLYVADFYNQRVLVLDEDGKSLRQLGETGKSGGEPGLFNYPTDVALLADGRLAVADAYNDRVQVFGSDGGSLGIWDGSVPGASDEPGGFRTATAVAASPGGGLYVADFFNHRVLELAADGRPLAILGGPAELDKPTDIAVDREGRVYVVDFGNSRIRTFSPENR